ncbi:lantibiotic immunity ABC transporter MutE/EpiE family permease subunit [Bacillaceae bacterium]
MIPVIQSEHLKYKRTFARRLTWLAPLCILFIAFPQKLFLPPGDVKPWALLLYQVFNWWPVLFIPLGTALFAALVQIQEKKAGNFRNLRVHPISPFAAWTGKIIVMAYHTLLAALVLVAAVLLSGLATAGREIPWAKTVAGRLILWLTSLAVLPLQLWAAAWKGASFSLAMGFAGMIAGVVAAPTPRWIYVPWSWPIRLMCPVIGVHPNGVPLEESDPLWDPSVLPVGIALAAASFAIFTVVTAAWFARRDVR